MTTEHCKYSFHFNCYCHCMGAMLIDLQFHSIATTARRKDKRRRNGMVAASTAISTPMTITVCPRTHIVHWIIVKTDIFSTWPSFTRTTIPKQSAPSSRPYRLESNHRHDDIFRTARSLDARRSAEVCLDMFLCMTLSLLLCAVCVCVAFDSHSHDNILVFRRKLSNSVQFCSIFE